MLSCWNRKESLRPSFTDIVAIITGFLMSTSNYLDLNAVDKQTKCNTVHDDIEPGKHSIARVPSNPNAYFQAGELNEKEEKHHDITRVPSNPNAYYQAGESNKHHEMTRVPSNPNSYYEAKDSSGREHHGVTRIPSNPNDYFKAEDMSEKEGGEDTNGDRDN